MSAIQVNHDVTCAKHGLEVEKAAKLLRDTAVGKIVTKVETIEDTIVYTGTDHLQFVRILSSSIDLVST